MAILEEGRIIDEVNLLDRRDRYRIRVSDAVKSQQVLKSQPFIRHVSARSSDEVVFMLGQQEGLGQIAGILSQAGIRIFEMGKDSFNLRSYYRERVEESRQERQDIPEEVEA